MQKSFDFLREQAQTRAKEAKNWALQERHKQQAKALRTKVEYIFTEHPREAGETYMQHLWFTVCMASRIILCGIALLIHGVFPFSLKRTTSKQMQHIYRILQTRLPERPGNDAGF